jgi:hypothetical protein
MGWSLTSVVVLHVKVPTSWTECCSVLVECSLMEKPGPLAEKDQFVQVNF